MSTHTHGSRVHIGTAGLRVIFLEDLDTVGCSMLDDQRRAVIVENALKDLPEMPNDWYSLMDKRWVTASKIAEAVLESPLSWQTGGIAKHDERKKPTCKIGTSSSARAHSPDDSLNLSSPR